MGEFVGFAAQAGIFFLFTPFCLLAQYGGRALDLRKAAVERRAVMRQYGIGDLAWQPAGEVTLDASGEPRMPTLPAAPGLRRLDFVGPFPGFHAVTINAASNLQGLASDRRPGRQFADDDMKAHLKIGGTIRVSYIDTVASSAGVLDLADLDRRRQVLDFMRQGAEIELARAA
ncbi:MAG TPA: hypothetical protein VM093_10045 [Aeromicrobium sp.]|nr:hypothetical protein [Aeromicrobium sp.]